MAQSKEALRKQLLAFGKRIDKVWDEGNAYFRKAQAIPYTAKDFHKKFDALMDKGRAKHKQVEKMRKEMDKLHKQFEKAK